MIDYKINIDEINKSQGLDLFNLIGKDKGNETKHRMFDLCQSNSKYCEIMSGVEYWNFDLDRRIDWCKNQREVERLINEFMGKLD